MRWLFLALFLSTAARAQDVSVTLDPSELKRLQAYLFSQEPVQLLNMLGEKQKQAVMAATSEKSKRDSDKLREDVKP